MPHTNICKEQTYSEHLWVSRVGTVPNRQPTPPLPFHLSPTHLAKSPSAHLQLPHSTPTSLTTSTHLNPSWILPPPTLPVPEWPRPHRPRARGCSGLKPSWTRSRRPRRNCRRKNMPSTAQKPSSCVRSLVSGPSSVLERSPLLAAPHSSRSSAPGYPPYHLRSPSFFSTSPSNLYSPPRP